MSPSELARPAGRRAPAVVPALVVLGAGLVAVLGCQSLAGSSSSPTSPVAAEPRPLRPAEPRPADPARTLGEADGVVPAGVTFFDDQYPAVANLDPGLRRAVRKAATDAARDRVTFSLESGWRSPKYQDHLLDEAIARYGSGKEAARWVATPRTSPHVSGDAIDIGPAAATAWLARHGATYGLCQIYRNEPWHYELRPEAPTRGCPPSYADPTQDPRMQR